MREAEGYIKCTLYINDVLFLGGVSGGSDTTVFVGDQVSFHGKNKKTYIFCFIYEILVCMYKLLFDIIKMCTTKP